MTHVISTNPSTGTHRELDIHETSLEQVRALCVRAHAAAPAIAKESLSWRAELLRSLADELDADALSLVDTAMEETALPRPRLEGELRRTSFQLRFFADVVDDGSFLNVSINHAGDSPMGPLPDLRRMRVPLGPIGVFGSSNFPFAFSVPGGDTASALAAGCPVVIKAHPAHPATSQRTFDALVRGAQKVGAPEGLLALVFGLDAGVALVDDGAIAGVGFTGSVAAGTALWRRANQRATPIPFYGELGSANPLVVTPSAADERGAEIGKGIAASMTLGVGQFCTKPGLLFVPDGESGDELVATLVVSLLALDPMTMLSSGIAEHFGAGVAALSKSPHVQQLVGDGSFNATTVSAQLFSVAARDFVHSTSSALHDECFGPSAVVIRYADHDELKNALNHTEPAVTFTLLCAPDDHDASWLLAHGETKAGRVIVNQYPTGVGVSWSMQHGGPWPSTTQAWATSVGASAIDRWLRPVTYQGIDDALLPPALRDANPLNLPRRVDGVAHTRP